MDYSAANIALWNILIQFGILAAAIITTLTLLGFGAYFGLTNAV